MMFLFVLSLSSAAWAIDIMIEIPNGDFEDGTLSGHTLTGTGIGKVVNSSVVSTAGSPATGPTAFETAFPVFGNFFATFSAGTPTTTLTTDSFWAEAGDFFKVYLGFDSEDWGGFFNDAMSWGLKLVSPNVVVVADVVADTDSLGAYGDSGWIEVLTEIPLSGFYQAEYSVWNEGDSAYDSWARVDAAHLIRKVPEPAINLLLPSALVVLGWTMQRRQKARMKNISVA